MSTTSPVRISGDSRAFPAGGGELGRLIREFDWSTTSLGPVSGWPQSLRTATDIVLQSPLPLVMLWGTDGVMIYNDAYSVFAGQRHPRLLGSKVLEGWAEVADFNAEVMRVGLAGGTLSFKDQQLTLYRNNVPEEVWMDLNYGPVPDESGRPAGVLAIVVETTGKVAAERALAAERAAVLDANKRLSAESAFLRDLFEQTPSFMALTGGPDHAFVLVNGAYKQLIGGRDVVGKTIREGLPEVVEQGFVDLLDTVYRSGRPFIGSGTRVMLQPPGADHPREHFLDFIYQPLRNADGEIIGIFIEGQDVTERLRGEMHMQLLVNELNHRVKNTLATIQAIAQQTFRNAEDLPRAQIAFSARIMALARANDLLTGQHWEGASLADVISNAVAALAGANASRVASNGPLVRLSPKMALSLSMAIHELATNAVKYGALSTDTGRVSIDWRLDGEGNPRRLHFEWRESGGPKVSPPVRRGFGSKLIERGLAAELGGTVEMRFDPDGLVCIIDASVAQYSVTAA